MNFCASRVSVLGPGRFQQPKEVDELYEKQTRRDSCSPSAGLAASGGSISVCVGVCFIFYIYIYIFKDLLQPALAGPESVLFFRFVLNPEGPWQKEDEDTVPLFPVSLTAGWDHCMAHATLFLARSLKTAPCSTGMRPIRGALDTSGFFQYLMSFAGSLGTCHTAPAHDDHLVTCRFQNKYHPPLRSSGKCLSYCCYYRCSCLMSISIIHGR